jgi:hypothetical protein
MRQGTRRDGDFDNTDGDFDNTDNINTLGPLLFNGVGHSLTVVTFRMIQTSILASDHMLL